MPRLIDANAFIEAHCTDCKYRREKLCTDDDLICSTIWDLSEFPTVDAVEVVHARWIKDQQSKFEHRYNCSACNYRLIDEPCNYCPNCGAKMDGGNEDV